MYLPQNKYLDDVFRVKISKPFDLPDRVPSVMDHGIFKFEFLPGAKRREATGNTHFASVNYCGPMWVLRSRPRQPRSRTPVRGDKAARMH